MRLFYLFCLAHFYNKLISWALFWVPYYLWTWVYDGGGVDDGLICHLPNWFVWNKIKKYLNCTNNGFCSCDLNFTKAKRNTKILLPRNISFISKAIYFIHFIWIYFVCIFCKIFVCWCWCVCYVVRRIYLSYLYMLIVKDINIFVYIEKISSYCFYFILFSSILVRLSRRCVCCGGVPSIKIVIMLWWWW